ncbi:MAG: hypothetical protein WCC26_16800 [Terracidiphilus sp.]
MASPRQSDRTTLRAKLFYEIAWTLASLIFLATGALTLQANAGSPHELGNFIAVFIGVFGLYGTVMGILAILDLFCPLPAPHPSTH